MRHASASLACVVLAVVALAGCEPQATGRSDAESKGMVASADASLARFQVTIYEVRVGAERIDALNADALAAKAETPDALEKALSAVGETKAMYVIDQTVNLADDRIRLSKREPFVTNTRVSESGRRMNAVQYEEVGAIFAITGEAGDEGLDVKVAIEMSAMTDGGTEVAPGVGAMVVRSVELGRTGPVHFGRPEVLVAVDASARNAKAGAVAYVCRLVFSKVES